MFLLGKRIKNFHSKQEAEMNKRHVITLSIFLAIFVFHTPAIANQSGLKIPKEITGDVAYEHVFYLSEVIGARVAGTSEEAETGEYIADQFEAMGYEVEIQPFTAVNWRGIEYSSENIIATKKGKIDQTVIVGAHYDSVSEISCPDGNVLTGAGDNASGVGVMLEVAKVLANYKTKGTIKFIAFGAEEVGLLGSRYYTEQMSEDEIKNTVTMINLDSVGAGDFFYVYSGWDDNPGWARDLALKIGQRMGYDLRTSPESDYFVYGTTGDWSDHRYFRMLGVPIAYFEWMNWDIEPDGGIETEEFGWIMHECLDNLFFTSIEKLELTADVVGALVFQLSKNKLPKSDKGKIAKGNKYISIQKGSGLPN
jgi:alkaline phosphatase isozyme conversion protein